MMRLVQLQNAKGGRCVAMVAEDRLIRVRGDSIYHLAQWAIERGEALEATVTKELSDLQYDYEPIYRGESEWRLLPAFGHPIEPARCLVSGTGLTHMASARNREAMHAVQKPEVLTDSMKMYQAGLEGGRPAPGTIGVAPEWFYKGCGTILRAHGESLEVPAFGLDGGEEAEVAGAYIIDPSGVPRRVGLSLANEFSDHKMEKLSYLHLAPSKLRTCAIGPELIVDAEFEDARGTVKIWRQGQTLWSKSFATGQQNMSHSLANLEHHHFKYPAHRRPGDVHIHFFGADVFSFGEGIELADGDEMEIELAGFGRALRNPLRIVRTAQELVGVEAL
jgi:hypothetical protein